MSKTQRDLAEKHDQELELMEQELLSAETEEVEEELEENLEEDTSGEESAPSEEKPAEEDESEIVEEEDTQQEDDELTDEEVERLSDKTRRQMSKLREKARLAEEYEKKIEQLEKREKVEKPLNDAIESVRKSEAPKSTLPWEQETLTPERVREITREENENEKRVTRIGLDADWLETTYEEFNPESASYDEELATHIYSSFKNSFLSDSSVRLKDHAEKHMRFLRKAQNRERAKVETEQRVNKQKASQAVPVSVAPAKKKTTVKDLISKAKTIEDLEKLERRL